MADPPGKGKKRSPAKSYEADTPSIPVRGHNKGQKAADARPDDMTTKSRRLKRKRTGQADCTLSTGGVVERNPQDPFQRLSSLEVGLVIGSLPVESTHTLRLVSKLWKACSEYHNGVLAIRRHFPHSALAKKIYETREEANLQFRRLLYHQESLKKGLATRATRCSSADFWALNGNTLLWASKSGIISVRNLRSAQNAPSTQCRTLNLDLFAHLNHPGQLCGASLTASGDLLLHVFLCLSANTRSTRLTKVRADSTHCFRLMRMSTKGQVLWEALHKTDDVLYKLAVGTKSFYYIYWSISMSQQCLCARSLEDGSVVLQKNIPFGHGQPHNYSDLFANEKWAAFGSGSTSIWLFDTTSGEMISSFRCDGWPVFSRTEEKFWEVEYTAAGSLKPCYECYYDANTRTFSRKRHTLRLDDTETMQTSSITFDPALRLCFRIKCEHPSPRFRLSIASLTAQDSVHEDGLRLARLIQGSNFAMVTLPTDLLHQGSTRRHPNFRLPAAMFRETGFSGVAGDYLVVPGPVGKTLVVVDFWPDW